MSFLVAVCRCVLKTGAPIVGTTRHGSCPWCLGSGVRDTWHPKDCACLGTVFEPTCVTGSGGDLLPEEEVSMRVIP